MEKQKMKVTELEVKQGIDDELYFELPDDLLERLGWEEGDDVKFVEKDGGFLITKVKYENIELELDDQELLKYMMFAHEQGITFNQLCEDAIKAKLNETDPK